MLMICHTLNNATDSLITEPVRVLLYQTGWASTAIMFTQKFVKMAQLVSANSYTNQKGHTHTELINGLQRKNSVPPGLTSS
jgi:hypothetical protein